jgi:hypothetical protein
MDCGSKKQVAQGKEENWTFKDLKSEYGETVIEGSWTWKTIEKIVFIDPILKGKDNNEYQWCIRNDLRVERNYINIDNIVRVSDCKTEFGWLQLFVQLNLKKIGSIFVGIFDIRFKIFIPFSKLNKISDDLNNTAENYQRSNVRNY